MPLSKEEKARRRALSAIQAGRHFHARGSANKALLDEIRTEAGTGPSATASSSRKRVRVEQIEATPAAPAPAAPLSDEDKEEEEEEEEEVRPEATKSVAQAPAESFETVLAKRAAQALAKQMGAPEPPPLPPSWFQDNVLAFYSSSEAFRSQLRAMRKTLDDEADEEQTYQRKHCRQCKKQGYSTDEWHLSCRVHLWPPEGHIAKVKQLEASLYDKFAAEAAQAALDRKSAEDKQARDKQREEDYARREREAQLALTLETMEPLCLRCARCVDLDFGVIGRTPDQMCGKHLEQYTLLACGP